MHSYQYSYFLRHLANIFHSITKFKTNENFFINPEQAELVSTEKGHSENCSMFCKQFSPPFKVSQFNCQAQLKI